MPKQILSKRRFVKTTPDKIRLISHNIKGRSPTQALAILDFSGKAAAKPLKLAIKSALAIAKDKNLNENDLIIKNILVNEGPKLKRRRIIQQGRATAILKRMSHITVVLTDEKSKVKNPKSKRKPSKQKIKSKNDK